MTTDQSRLADALIAAIHRHSTRAEVIESTLRVYVHAQRDWPPPGTTEHAAYRHALACFPNSVLPPDERRAILDDLATDEERENRSNFD